MEDLLLFGEDYDDDYRVGINEDYDDDYRVGINEDYVDVLR